MKQLVLVRSGQSELHTRDLTGGWTDCELTELGYRQGVAVAQALTTLLTGRSVRVYGSDLRRAAETARVIARAQNSEPVLRGELRELNNGQAAGLTRQQAKAIELPVTRPTEDWQPYPQAESWRMMTGRLFRAMDNIDREVEDTAVVVSHANAAMAIIAWWLRVEEMWRKKIAFALDPGSISVMALNRWDERVVMRLNDTSHLAELLGQRDRPARGPREIARRLLASGKFLNLQAIRYIGRDGQPRMWEVAERIGGRNAVMLIAWLKPSDRLVLVRQFRPPALGHVIEFPAGIIADGEGPEQAAVRELHEETGYRGQVLDVTVPAFNTPGISNDAAHIVLMEIDETTRENANAIAHPEDGEEIEVVLVGRQRITEFVENELALNTCFDCKVLAYLAGIVGA